MFKKSSSAKSFIRSSFSLSEFYFPYFILTILYIVSISDISSSISTNSSFVHSKSILLVLYKLFFLGQLYLNDLVLHMHSTWVYFYIFFLDYTF